MIGWIVLWKHLSQELALTSEMWVFSSTITTWELVQNQVEWNETNSTFCSYPFGEAECEGEWQAAKCFAQGGVTFPEITTSYSKFFCSIFSSVFDCLYTISGNTFRTGKPYHHLETVEPRNQGKLSQWQEIFAVLHIISQLQGSRYFFKGGKHTSDVA